MFSLSFGKGGTQRSASQLEAEMKNLVRSFFAREGKTCETRSASAGLNTTLLFISDLRKRCSS